MLLSAAVRCPQITGESMPVSKAAGDIVFGSTVNQLGSLVMVAQGVGKDTALNQVVRLVQVILAGDSGLWIRRTRRRLRFSRPVLFSWSPSTLLVFPGPCSVFLVGACFRWCPGDAGADSPLGRKCPLFRLVPGHCSPATAADWYLQCKDRSAVGAAMEKRN